jgi:hypothetical protein
MHERSSQRGLLYGLVRDVYFRATFSARKCSINVNANDDFGLEAPEHLIVRQPSSRAMRADSGACARTGGAMLAHAVPRPSVFVAAW